MFIHYEYETRIKALPNNIIVTVTTLVLVPPLPPAASSLCRYSNRGQYNVDVERLWKSHKAAQYLCAVREIALNYAKVPHCSVGADSSCGDLQRRLVVIS